MAIALEQRTATLRYAHGTPVALLWDGNHWLVLDTPTRLDPDADASYSPLLTHAPEPWPSWRFIAGAPTARNSYIFDVRVTSLDGGCVVLHVRE